MSLTILIDLPNVLTLDSLGVALVVFSISQTMSQVDKLYEFLYDKDEKGQYNPKGNMYTPTMSNQLSHLRSKLLFYRFTQVIGTGYFLSVLTLSIRAIIRSDSVVLLNFSALLSLVPTVAISIVYIAHRLLRGKLIDVGSWLRRKKHIELD